VVSGGMVHHGDMVQCTMVSGGMVHYGDMVHHGLRRHGAPLSHGALWSQAVWCIMVTW
jgi:hypothetical protein